MKNYYNKASQDITSWSPTQDYAFLHNSLKKKINHVNYFYINN